MHKASLLGAVVAVVLLAVMCVVEGQKLTTPYIEHVFKGKCLWKNSLPTPPPIVRSYVNVSAYCDALWDRFSLTARLPFVQQTNETWAPFFELSDFSSPRDGAMLWSGSYTFTQTLTNKYTTLEETSTGYILNELWWCPSILDDNTTYTDFNYTSPCVYDDPAPGHYSLAAIWREASRRFAIGISGEVVVLLQSRMNSTVPPMAPFTYRTTSIFGSIELPALDPQAVTSLVALYMPGDRNYLPTENCTAGTLLRLRDDVNTRFAGYNVPYYCFDDNRLLMKFCTNRTNEELVNIETGIDSLGELLAYVSEFDFATAQTSPECAVGVLSYMSGYDDTIAVVGPIVVNQTDQITALQGSLNSTQQQLDYAIYAQNETSSELAATQTQLNNTQAVLANTQDTLSHTETQLNNTESALVDVQRQLNDTQAQLQAAQKKIWELEHHSTAHSTRPLLAYALLCACICMYYL